jgi:hypothetical protein
VLDDVVKDGSLSVFDTGDSYEPRHDPDPAAYAVELV